MSCKESKLRSSSSPLDALKSIIGNMKSQSEDLLNRGLSIFGKIKDGTSKFFSSEGSSGSSISFDPSRLVKKAGDAYDRFVENFSFNEGLDFVSSIGKKASMKFLSSPEALIASVSLLSKDLSDCSLGLTTSLSNLDSSIDNLGLVIGTVDRTNIDRFDANKYKELKDNVSEIKSLHEDFVNKSKTGNVNLISRAGLIQKIESTITSFAGTSPDVLDMKDAVDDVVKNSSKAKSDIAQFIKLTDALIKTPDNIVKLNFSDQTKDFPKMTSKIVDDIDLESSSESLSPGSFSKIDAAPSVIENLSLLKSVLSNIPSDIGGKVQDLPEFPDLQSMVSGVGSIDITSIKSLGDSTDKISNIAQRSLVIDMSGGVYDDAMAPFKSLISSSMGPLSSIVSTIGSFTSLIGFGEKDAKTTSDLLTGSGMDNYADLYASGDFNKIGASAQSDATTIGRAGREIRGIMNDPDRNLLQNDPELFRDLEESVEKIDALERSRLLTGQIAMSESSVSAGSVAGRTKLLSDIADGIERAKGA